MRCQKYILGEIVQIMNTIIINISLPKIKKEREQAKKFRREGGANKWEKEGKTEGKWEAELLPLAIKYKLKILQI